MEISRLTSSKAQLTQTQLKQEEQDTGNQLICQHSTNEGTDHESERVSYLLV